MLLRKTLLSLLIVFVVLMGTGCANDNEVYQKAVNRTGEISKGKSKFTIDMDMEWSDELKANTDFKPFELKKFEVENKFDKTKEISQSTVYAQINDLGIDAKLYQNGDQYYLISPLIPKILIVKDDELTELKNGNVSSYNEQPITDETMNKIEELWNKQLSNQDVTKLANIILTNPEGDVKAKEFRVNLTKEDLRFLLLKSVDILSEDPLLNQQIEQMLKEAKIGEDPLTVEQFWEGNRKWIEGSDIGPLSYLAYINRDNYIIEEKLRFEMHGPSSIHLNDQNLDAGMNAFSFLFNLQRWDIEKDVEIQFPEVTKENSMTLDELYHENSFLKSIQEGKRE